MKFFYHIYCKKIISIMDELLDNEEIDVNEKILGISKLLDSPATLEIINDDVVGIEEKNAIMNRITRLIAIAEKENYTLDGSITFFKYPPFFNTSQKIVADSEPDKPILSKIIIMGLHYMQHAILRLVNLGFKNNILAICDETNNYVGKSLCLNDGTDSTEIPVIDFNKLVNMYRTIKDIAILLTGNRMQLNPFLEPLKYFGITNIYIVPTYVYWDESTNFMKLLKKVPLDRPVLNYYEYQPTRYCNLNCYHCGNYSNLMSGKPVILDKEQYIKDVKRLGELFWNVGSMRFQGGDPLMAAEILPELMQVTRETFPYADMALLSNGLLIPKIDPKVFEAMRKYHFYFWLSGYPPTYKIYDKIQAICNAENIPVSIMPPITNWHATNLKAFELEPLKDRKTLEELWSKCVEKDSVVLEDGHLYRCCFPSPNTPTIYKRFGWNIAKNQMWNNLDKFRVNIYDPDFDGFKFNESLKMENMLECCQYCANVRANYKSISWKTCTSKHAKIKDYYWEEPKPLKS